MKNKEMRSVLEDVLYESPCGNLVDGLPHDWHTETIAKLARRGPAENGKPMDNFVEVTMFCSRSL